MLEIDVANLNKSLSEGHIYVRKLENITKSATDLNVEVCQSWQNNVVLLSSP